MSWTAEREKKLKELWTKGHTASQIANLIGGITRNAVIGKAHRLKLEARAASKNSYNKKNLKTSDEQTQQHRPKSRRERFRSLLIDKNFEPENPKKLEELTDVTCRWPIGHPDEEKFYFCGRTPVKDFSYCKLHVLYAFQPKNKKEDPIEKEDEIPQFMGKKIKSA